MSKMNSVAVTSLESEARERKFIHFQFAENQSLRWLEKILWAKLSHCVMIFTSLKTLTGEY